MEDFIPQLLILLLSGLGFITYRHPKQGRKLTTIISIVVASVISLVNAYSLGASRGYIKSLRKFTDNSEFHTMSLKSIQNLANEEELFRGKVDIWMLCIIVTYFTILLLSFMFEDMQKKVVENDNKSTKGDPS